MTGNNCRIVEIVTLARTVITIVFSRTAERYPQFQLEGEPSWRSQLQI
jgi:hypothetical protein